MIHKTVCIDPSAKIADDVVIGPYSIIGPNVTIGEGTHIEAHVVIKRDTKIGKRNRIHSFAAVGGDPQDSHYRDEPTELHLGDENTIREYVTLNRGSTKADGVTRIGNQNMFLAYSHVAHDCRISRT